MIYYRSNSDRTITVRQARVFTAISLFAYPAGALTLALGPDDPWTNIIGFALIVASLIFFVPLNSCWLQRIVAEQPSKLDEYELKLRSRAMNAAYIGFTVLVLLAVVYAAIASDAGGFVPRTYDEFNGLFWGAFLYSTILPVACLSWIVDQSADPAS